MTIPTSLVPGLVAITGNTSRAIDKAIFGLKLTSQVLAYLQVDHRAQARRLVKAWERSG